MIPSLLVAAGYVVVLRHMGLAPGYGRLAVAMAVFFGAILWLARSAARKAGAGQR
jgi:uncharacterized membrane protein